VAVEDLELLRCPKGCDPEFLQYLIWEGTELRICAQHRMQSEHGAWYDVVDIGLRCGDCGTQFGRKNIPYAAKRELDQMLDRHRHDLDDFQDEINDAWLRMHFGQSLTPEDS